MSGPTESVNNIHDNRQGGSTYSPRSTLAPQKRKIGDGGESFVTRKQVPRTSQGSEKMPRNHGNGKASHDAAFSIEKILSPTSNCKDAEHASVWSPGAVKITKKTGRSPSPPAPDGKTLMTNFLDKSEGEERAEVVNGADSMPADKWYNTLLWQQHQQLYQQQLAAASAFYHHHHTQQFQQHVLADPTHHMQQPHIGPVPVPIPGSGVPPSFCPGMPGKVHPFNCHCAEQIHEQPYFLLTPAGYSIPSPFEPDHHHSSPRYCRRRKARTVFNEYQIRGLEARFVHQQYLSTHERVELANVLFLTEGQVKTWFQNRRMKQKKLTRDSVHPFDTDADDEDNDKLEFDEEDEVDDDLDNEDLAKKSRSDDTQDKYKFKK